MAEFRIELELQGLKLKISGSREDVPIAMHHIGRQVTGMLGPIADIVEGEIVEDTAPVQEPLLAPAKKRSARKSKRTTTPAAAGNGTHAGDEAVSWRHDASKWGYPLQEWKGWEKALWVLYVIVNETTHTELTTNGIVQSFNTQFQRAGQIAPIQVTRDLEKRKSAPHLFVGSDATQGSERWYLHDKGKKHAQTLVAAALGQEKAAAVSG